MKAVILAGGRGTRLAPHTTILPKPLLPLGDKPILDVIIRQLRHHGITDITLAVGHLAELLMSYFGDGRQFGVRISYSREEKPLGTAGPLRLVPGLAETFLVMNGDILTTLDFRDLLANHEARRGLGMVAVQTRRIPIDLGVVEHDADCRLTRYVEKPVRDARVSMGIYAFEPRVLEFIPSGEYLDLPDLMTRLIQAGEHIYCHPFEGYWMDIGRSEDYARAAADFDELELRLFRSG